MLDNYKTSSIKVTIKKQMNEKQDFFKNFRLYTSRYKKK